MAYGSYDFPMLLHGGISVFKTCSQNKGTSMTDTIRQLIDNGAGDAAVLGAPGRPAMTYRRLAALADTTVQDLNAPEMAAAFLAIAPAPPRRPSIGPTGRRNSNSPSPI
jgi:hypothetical protein